MSREEFIELARLDAGKLYDLISARFEALENRIKELEARLNQNSKNSNKPPSSDIFHKPNKDRKTSRRKSGGQEGHRGNNLKMVSNPTETILHEAPDNCEKCGESLKDISPKIVISQEFELPKMEINVTEHQVEKKKCMCGHLNLSKDANAIRKHTYYGDRFKSFILYLKNHHMLPFARTKEIIKDIFNHNISEGTFWNIEKDFSEKLKPIENEIKQEIIASNCAGFDETGVRSNKRNFWVHTAVTKLFSHFSFNIKRGLDGMNDADILPKFKGIAMHDFFKPYLKFLCKHAFCNAHILRELIAVYENTKQVWADMMIQVLITALDSKKEGNITESTINEIISMYDLAIKKGYEENPDADIGKKKSRSKELNLLKRLDEYKDNIMLFLSSDEVPFDNNLAERALRMLKVKNKISGCFRNQDSGIYFCRLRSFIESCKKQNLSIIDSIYSVFHSQNFSFLAE